MCAYQLHLLVRGPRDSALASRRCASCALLMNESSPQRQLAKCRSTAGAGCEMNPVMNRIGNVCPSKPVYYVAITVGYSESWSQWMSTNFERLFMSTAATSALYPQGALCYRALVNYYWTNLPLVLPMLVQALGAPVGRPIIRKGLPSTEHLHKGSWLVKKVLVTEVSAAGLVCPLVMGKCPNFLTLDAVGNRPLLSAWPAGHCS